MLTEKQIVKHLIEGYKKVTVGSDKFYQLYILSHWETLSQDRGDPWCEAYAKAVRRIKTSSLDRPHTNQSHVP